MTEELKQAAQRVASAWHACGRYPDSTADIESLDAAINTLEALTTSQPAQAGEVDGSIAASLGDIVAVWEEHAPSDYMTAIHMQAKRALAGQQPVSPDMHGWCAYVGGMVAHWVTSEPDAHARLGDERFDAAIAGIIKRRLWAMPKPTQPAQADANCQTCNGHGLVGGHMQDGSGYGEGCPDCNPEPAPLVKWASTQPAAQATPDVPETDFGNKATPEPVGEVVAWWYGTHPRPSIETIRLDHTFTDHAGEYIKGRPLVFGDAHPAPGVPDGEPKLTQEELLEVAKHAWLMARTADSLQFYRTLLSAAAQAKGGEHA